MKRVLFSALLIALMSSCSKEMTDTTSHQREIRLRSGITQQTRTAYNGDVAVSDLQFLRKDASQTTNDYSGCVALAGNRAVGGAITFGNPQFYDESKNTYFASYYPATTVNNNVATWTIDGKTDIMTAATVDVGSQLATNPSASLSYLHQLAQIEVICKAADESGNVQARWGNITGIRLLATPTTLSYAYNGLTVTPGGTTGAIALVASDYATDFTAIAVPASTNSTVNAAGMFIPSTSQTIQLEVATEKEDTKTISIDLGEGQSFQRSKKHIITLTFQPTAVQIPIAVSSTIEAWSPGASGSGNVN